MKFYEALKEMQENKEKARVIGKPDIYYFWGSVLDVPCLKNSLGHEVLANSWLMRAKWELVPKAEE